MYQVSGVAFCLRAFVDRAFQAANERLGFGRLLVV
jgi:hypothetical protein